MRIDTIANQTGTFSFHTNNKAPASNDSTRVAAETAHSTKASVVNGDEKVTVVNPVRWKEIEYHTTLLVDQSSRKLHEGLKQLFKEENEKIITGKSTEEYRNHIKELTAAIEGQDFKNAEKIIDKFYRGDKKEIVQKVQSLAKSVTDDFWNKLRDQFKEMAVVKSRTVYANGEKPEEALPYVLRAIARARIASEDLAIKPKDLADRVRSSISSGIDFSKSKLDDAGQNRYSEDAKSVTAATVVEARNNIYGSNEEAFSEGQKKIDQINEEMCYNYKISDKSIDDFDTETRRYDDDFSKYVREGGDQFLEAIKSELGEMKLASRYESTVAEEQAYQDYQNKQNQHQVPKAETQGRLIVDMTVKIQNSKIQKDLLSPIKATELYDERNKKDEDFFYFETNDESSVNRII